MTPQQVVGLGVRFFAIFVALQSIKYLVGVPASLATNNIPSQIYIAYGFGGFCLVFSAALWFFPMVVASAIIPKTRFENHMNVQALDAARVGGSLIGLWFFANALPSILWFIFRGAINTTMNQSIIGSLATDEKAELAFYAAELVLAFILIFKSHIFAAVAMRKIDSAPDSENAL